MIVVTISLCLGHHQLIIMQKINMCGDRPEASFYLSKNRLSQSCFCSPAKLAPASAPPASAWASGWLPHRHCDSHSIPAPLCTLFSCLLGAWGPLSWVSCVKWRGCCLSLQPAPLKVFVALIPESRLRSEWAPMIWVSWLGWEWTLFVWDEGGIFYI